jgi:catechol 2,3-dioxygenase-like lactoylglutathione lyase family enzyme
VPVWFLDGQLFAERKNRMSAFSFDHVHIYSPNVDNMVESYERVFGATVIRRLEVNNAPLVHLNLNGIRIVISQCSDLDQDKGLQHFAMSINDLSKAKKILLEHGIEIEKENEVNQYRNLFFKDIDGIRIEIISPSTK